jgi:hypothetical protein
MKINESWNKVTSFVNESDLRPVQKSSHSYGTTVKPLELLEVNHDLVSVNFSYNITVMRKPYNLTLKLR